MQNNFCFSVKSSDQITGSLGCNFGCIFLEMVASFLVALRSHFSRLRLLFSVPSLTLYFSAKSLNVISDVSHSSRIASQLGIYIITHPHHCVECINSYFLSLVLFSASAHQLGLTA